MTFDEIIGDNYTEEEKTEIQARVAQDMDYLLSTRMVYHLCDRLLGYVEDPMAVVQALREIADELEDIFGDEQEC